MGQLFFSTPIPQICGRRASENQNAFINQGPSLCLELERIQAQMTQTKATTAGRTGRARYVSGQVHGGEGFIGAKHKARV